MEPDWTPLYCKPYASIVGTERWRPGAVECAPSCWSLSAMRTYERLGRTSSRQRLRYNFTSSMTKNKSVQDSSSLTSLSAFEIARLVNRKELSPVEVTEAHLS